VSVVGEDMYSISNTGGIYSKSDAFVSKYNVEPNLWQKLPSRPCNDALGYRICIVATETYLYVIGGNWSGKVLIPSRLAKRFDIVEGKCESIRAMNKFINE